MVDPLPVLVGAEPYAASGGPHGALVLHGFTGTPQSVRPLAERLAAEGFTVELPLLPGHGTSLDDMLTTGWSDWSAAAESAYVSLAGRCDSVVVCGLSMGGTLALWLATRHPAIAGLAVVNPAVEALDPAVLEGLRAQVEAGDDVLPAIGSDIADPDQAELAYEGTPVRPLLSLQDAIVALRGELGRVEVPVLILTSPQDHVVAPSSSDVLAGAVSGPVERVTLERSYHVATLDHDRALIEDRVAAFASRVTAG